MRSSGGKSVFTLLLVILVVIMSFELIVLIRQNRRLQSMLADTDSVQALREGQSLPPLTAADLEGVEVSIRYGQGGPSTVLIWFSPSCHICSENAEFWNELYDRYKTSPTIRFLAMSDAEPGETRAYVAEHALELPAVSVTDPALIDAYDGHVVPQTAIVSSHGKIERVWPGALDGKRQEEIVSVLDSLAT